MNNTKTKLNKVKELNTNLILALSDTIIKQSEVLTKLTEINCLLESIQIDRPDHGKKPMCGYVNKELTIPFVKLEAVLDYLSRKTNIPRNKIKYHHVWKLFKKWIKENYDLVHEWRHVIGVHGVMVIYSGINLENMISIIDQFIKENNLRKEP